MRVTEGMKFGSVQRTLADLRSRRAEVEQQVSSGQRVLAPSSDPVAAAELVRLSGRLARTQDYRKTISAVEGDASLTERSLAQASGLMVRAKELALQGANGTLSAEDRQFLAIEVEQLKAELVATANTRGERGYLFAGSQTDSAAFDEAGLYLGDDVERQVEVAPGVSHRVLLTGSEVFTGANGGTDAFQVLDELQAALESNDAEAVAGTLTRIEDSRSQIVRFQSTSGLILSRLEAADEALSVTELQLQTSQAEHGEVDVFQALSQLTELSVTLERAIAVARTTLSTSVERF